MESILHEDTTWGSTDKLIKIGIPNDEKCGCEIRCGCFNTKRRTIGRLAFLNNPKGALFFLSLTAFLQGAVISGFYNISVSTLEKRFGLRSSETGFISSAYDIAGCFAIPVFSYIGGAGHKPMWIASGTLILGMGSILFTFPYFIAPPYSIVGIETFDCQLLESCSESSMRAFRGFFIVSQMLMGIGATPLYILALAYLDENVEQVRSSTYHGIFFASALLGPGVGYILGGYLLSHFTTLEDPKGFSPDSPLWIGNWWLGFLVAGIIFIILSIPLFMFPVRMPETEKFRLNRNNEMHQQEDSLSIKEDQEFGKSIKDAPRSLLILLKNPTIVFISIANSFDSGMMLGLATFGPKFVENMFAISPTDAAFYFGVLAIATASSAHLLCGILISKLQLNVKQMLRMSLVCAMIAFCCLFIFLSSCDNLDIAGVSVPYPETSDIHCVESDCGCSTNLYRPICGSDNLTYLSFCDAGCSIVDSENFENCTKMGNTSTGVYTATTGVCKHGTCQKLPLFLVFIGFAVFFTFMKAQPTLQSSLRAVPFSQRSFMLGTEWLIVRLLGSIPMPIIYGKVLDLSCLMWGRECEECASCHVYDNLTMATSMAWLNLILKGINICFLVVVNFTYKPPLSEPPHVRLRSTVAEVTVSSNSL